MPLLLPPGNAAGTGANAAGAQSQLTSLSPMMSSSQSLPQPQCDYIHGGYHNRILLALRSGLPNEIDWALTQLLTVSYTNDDFFLPAIPGLLPELVSLCDGYIAEACREDLDAITAADPAGLQRLTLVLHCLRNLSFSNPSFYLLVPLRRFFLKLLALPAHVLAPKLQALEVLENVAFTLAVDADDSHNMMAHLTACAASADRAFALSALRVLARLAINDANERAFAAAVSPPLLAHLCSLLTLPNDPELCLTVLEYLYQSTQISPTVADAMAAALPSHAVRLILRCIMRSSPPSRAFDAPAAPPLYDSPSARRALRREMRQRLNSFAMLDPAALQAQKISVPAAACAPVLFWLRWRVEPCPAHSTSIVALIADLHASTLLASPPLQPINNTTTSRSAGTLSTGSPSIVTPNFNPLLLQQSSPHGATPPQQSQPLQESNQNQVIPGDSEKMDNESNYGADKPSSSGASGRASSPPTWMRQIDTEQMLKILLSVCPSATLRDTPVVQGVRIRNVVPARFVFQQLEEYYQETAQTSEAGEPIVQIAFQRAMQKRFGARRFCRWQDCPTTRPFESARALRDHLSATHACANSGLCGWRGCVAPMRTGHLDQHLGADKMYAIYDESDDEGNVDSDDGLGAQVDGLDLDCTEPNMGAFTRGVRGGGGGGGIGSAETRLVAATPSPRKSALIWTPSAAQQRAGEAAGAHHSAAVQQQIATEISKDPTGLPYTAALVLRNLARTSKSDILFADVADDIVLACARYPRISKHLMWSLGT